ncbi:MAG: GNAT family N-acetyltransferase [bacterium]
MVGHVAFSEVGPPEQSGWFALGPVSVDPPLQRRGVGSQLIEAGLRTLREQDAKGCSSPGTIATITGLALSLRQHSHRLNTRPSISRLSVLVTRFRIAP